MSLNHFRALSVVFLGCLSASVVQAATYSCAVRDTENSGWIAEPIYIQHDESTGEVVVIDPVIYYYNDKEGLLGKVSVDNEKRITFSWKLEGVSVRDQHAVAFSYRATVQKSDGRLTVYTKPLGYNNDFKGRGTCALTED